MVKVYLVEDEIIIRQSIKNSIDWEKEGYEFVGDASDGELALPVILKEKPDILITDIRMPFMDGLELSRMVKAELPDIKIVILSGYDDFEYAKQAIKIGVAEYLLKPVSSAVLLEHLSEIAEKVRDEREDLALKKVYYQEMQENEELIKMKFLGELISGKLSLADAMEKGKRFHMNLSGPFTGLFCSNLSRRIMCRQSSLRHWPKPMRLSAAMLTDSGMFFDSREELKVGHFF